MKHLVIRVVDWVFYLGFIAIAIFMALASWNKLVENVVNLTIVFVAYCFATAFWFVLSGIYDRLCYIAQNLEKK